MPKLTRDEFEAQARAYAESKYAYGGMVDDNADRLDGAIEADETPEYWIEALAVKYDFDPVNQWI